MLEWLKNFFSKDEPNKVIQEVESNKQIVISLEKQLMAIKLCIKDQCYDKAINELKKRDQDYPNNQEIKFLLAKCFYQTKQFQEAEIYLLQVIKSAEQKINLGMAYRYLSKITLAQGNSTSSKEFLVLSYQQGEFFKRLEEHSSLKKSLIKQQRYRSEITNNNPIVEALLRKTYFFDPETNDTKMLEKYFAAIYPKLIKNPYLDKIFTMAAVLCNEYDKTNIVIINDTDVNCFYKKTYIPSLGGGYNMKHSIMARAKDSEGNISYQAIAVSLAHEITHMVSRFTYDFKAYPFKHSDTQKALKLNKIIDNILPKFYLEYLNEDIKGTKLNFKGLAEEFKKRLTFTDTTIERKIVLMILRTFIAYEDEDLIPEIIVTIPELLADERITAEDIKAVVPELFEFFEKEFIPDVEKYIESKKNLIEPQPLYSYTQLINTETKDLELKKLYTDACIYNKSYQGFFEY